MIAPDDPRHGTNAGHNAGCRCRECGEAKLRYDKRRRFELHTTGQRRVVPSHRAVRRLHALQALGYSVRVIAEEAGLCTKTLYDISLERSANVWRSHFEPLADAYERLAGTVPTGRYVARNRRYAEKKGWPPPLAWDDIDNDPDPVRLEVPMCAVEDCHNPAERRDWCHMHYQRLRRAGQLPPMPAAEQPEVDEVVIERVLSGTHVPAATYAERVEIVARWRATGRPLADLERLTGWKPERYRTDEQAAS